MPHPCALQEMTIGAIILLLLMRRTCILYFATFHPKWPFKCGQYPGHIPILINDEKGKCRSDYSNTYVYSSMFSIGLYNFISRKEILALTPSDGSWVPVVAFPFDGGDHPVAWIFPSSVCFWSLVWPWTSFMCSQEWRSMCLANARMSCLESAPCLCPAWLFPGSASDLGPEDCRSQVGVTTSCRHLLPGP